MRVRHYQVIRPSDGRPLRIRTARGEVPIRADELGDLISDLQKIDAEINPKPAYPRDAAMRDGALTGEG